MQVKCVDVSLVIVFVLLVSALVGWTFFHQRKERRDTASTEPLLKFMGEGESDGRNVPWDRKVDNISSSLFSMLNP